MESRNNESEYIGLMSQQPSILVYSSLAKTPNAPKPTTEPHEPLQRAAGAIA